MTEEVNTGGNPEMQVDAYQPPGDDAAPQSAPNGGDPTQAGPSPSRWTKERLDSLFKKGRNEGVSKGARDAEAALLERFKEFGFESFDTVFDSLSALQQPQGQGEAEQPSRQTKSAKLEEQKREEAQYIRSLKEENGKAKSRLEQLERELSVFKEQAKHAMITDLKLRLRSMGAHEGVDDLVSILIRDHLKWSDDGREIQVYDRREDGEYGLSYETLDEFLERQKTTKPYFFTPPQKQGSSYSGGPPPRQSPAPTQNGNFHDRLKARRSR